MSEQLKPSDRIIAALKEVERSAKCDHEKIEQPETARFRKFYCIKCRATFWEPKTALTSGHGGEK